MAFVGVEAYIGPEYLWNYVK